jgi:hypothetical protein
MAQDSAPSATQEDSKKAQLPGKLTISSVMTRARLLSLIKERNPIIAIRDQPKSRHVPLR